MKIKEKTKVIEQKIITYVAYDGTEFRTEKECKDYEQNKIFEKLIEPAEKLRIAELDDCLPISDDGLTNDNNTFRWYKLENKEDFEVVNSAYGYTLDKPKIYPTIMCVETCGYEPYKDDAYSYDMTICKEITQDFWKKLGYKVTIEQLE